MNIKKLIAREGLIILSVAAIIIISFYLFMSLENANSEYKNNADIMRVYETDRTPRKHVLSTGKEITIVKMADPTNIYIMVQKGTSQKIFDEILRKDFSHLKNAELISSEKNWNIKIAYYYDITGKKKSMIDFEIFFILSLFLYPAYLLIRFIWWAIYILRLSN